MGRKGKELSPERKKNSYKFFERGNSITKISRLLQRSHSTASSFIRCYLLRDEIKKIVEEKADLKQNYAPRIQKTREVG